VLYALSAGQKTGLGLMAAGFIAFALASSFWLPRYRPDFPGRWLKLFAVVSVVLTIGMLATVIAGAILLARPPREGAGGTAGEHARAGPLAAP